jgi:hypothetical protein
VQSQLGQLGDVAARQRLDRILVLAHRQQGREVADVLLEEVEDRRDPALAEPHARAHPLGLELVGPGVGGLLEERDARLAPELLAEEEGRVGGHGHLHAGDRLRGVPVRGERIGLDLAVQLDAGAGRLGGDRVGVGRQALDAADVDLQVLPARREDLLVEQRVARVGAQRARVEVLAVDRRQDPDDHHVRPGGARAVLGVVEAPADRLLELGEHRRGELPRRDVDLDVELPELGLEVGVGDGLEHRGVGQRGAAVVVGQVELDLQPERSARRLEALVGQHAREDVQRRAHLLAIALAVGTAEHPGGNVLAHGCGRQCSRRTRSAQPLGAGALRLRARARVDLRPQEVGEEHRHGDEHRRLEDERLHDLQ